MLDDLFNDPFLSGFHLYYIYAGWPVRCIPFYRLAWYRIAWQVQDHSSVDILDAQLHGALQTGKVDRQPVVVNRIREDPQFSFYFFFTSVITSLTSTVNDISFVRKPNPAGSAPLSSVIVITDFPGSERFSSNVSLPSAAG